VKTRRSSTNGFGWYDRGYLPHYDGGAIPQFITFRLADSVPLRLVEFWKHRFGNDATYRKRIEKWLDRGHGSCALREPAIAEIVQATLLYHRGRQYTLHAWVVMPNHVHILLTPNPLTHLDKIMHSIKSYTAHEANRILGSTGRFWQRESYDRFIRNEKHFSAAFRYIENNPVKARFCGTAAEWRFGSAWYRENSEG
jgi:putative DNA methylase